MNFSLPMQNTLNYTSIAEHFHAGWQHVTAALLRERLLKFGNQDALMGTKICDLRMYLYFKKKL